MVNSMGSGARTTTGVSRRETGPQAPPANVTAGNVMATFFAEHRALCDELAWYRRFGEDVRTFLADQGERFEDAFTEYREMRDEERATEAKAVAAKRSAVGGGRKLARSRR